MSKLFPIFRSKKQNSSKPYKYFKPKESEDIIDKFVNLDVSESCIDVWEKDNGGFHPRLKELRVHVKRLIKFRNQLFTKLCSMQDFFWESGVYQGYTKNDVAVLCRFNHDIRGIDDVSLHSLWQIKPKKSERDIYNDDELSE
jgi:hypothetical protein